MVFIYSSLHHLAVGSRDLSQAKKKITVAKTGNHRMKIIFNQNGQKLSFWVKFVVILKICSALAAVIFFSAWDKSCDPTVWTDVDHLHLSDKRGQTLKGTFKSGSSRKV